MAANIPVNPTWDILKFDALCKTWTAAANDSNQVRMQSSAEALQALVQKLNHILGVSPRIIFSKALPFADRQTTASNPLYVWRFDDLVPNARIRMFTVLAVDRTVDPISSSQAYWQRLDGALGLDANTIGPKYSSEPGTRDVTTGHMEQARYSRGSPPVTTEHQEGIATIQNHSVWEVCVQEEPVGELIDGDHLYAWANAKKGMEVLGAGGGAIKQIRTLLHSIRSKNLPIMVSWAGYKDGANWATTGLPLGGGGYGGDARGIRINSTNFLNVLDGTTTGNTAGTRSATVAGWPSFARYMGRGNEFTTEGKKLTLQCRVFATAPGLENDATVRFIGPDTFGSNSTDITVTAGGSAPAWYGTSSNKIHLDTKVTETDTSTQRAKVDVFGTSNDAAENLYIYGIRCWAEYAI